MSKALADRVLTPAFRGKVEAIMTPHARKAYSRAGKVARDCAEQTRIDRRTGILRSLAELHTLGYRLSTPKNLKQKHIQALAEHWRAKGIAARTLHKRFSMLRVFARWMGKRDLVGDLDEYFLAEETRRPIAATSNKAWEANGVNVAAKIAEAAELDERLAVMMSLQHHIGLRMKEAIELRPLKAELPVGGAIMVSDGTKGGRPRIVPLETEGAREAFLAAKLLAAKTRSRRLRWPDCPTWRKAQRRYTYYMERLGITKRDLGVTSHGLRHGNIQAFYRRRTGLPTPVEGGALGRIDREQHQQVSLEASRNLGHGRLDVTGFYYGSYGHSLRKMKVVYRADGHDIVLSPGVVEEGGR